MSPVFLSLFEAAAIIAKSPGISIYPKGVCRAMWQNLPKGYRRFPCDAHRLGEPYIEVKGLMESLQCMRDSLGRLVVKPWRLVGFGYYQAWIYLAVLSTVLFTQSDFFAERLQFTRQYFSLSVAGFLFVLVFVSLKLDILEKRRYLLVATAALTAVGTVLIALPLGNDSAKLAVVATGITLTGMGNAFLIIGWGALWSKMDTDRMGLHLVVSNAFAGCLYLIVTQLPVPAAVAVTAALPLCSVLTLLSSENEPRRSSEGETTARPKKLIGKAVAAIAVIPFVFGLARAFSSPADAVAFSDLQYRIVMGTTAFAVAIALLAALAPRQRIVLRLYRFVVPLMAAGFIALPFVPDHLQWVAFAAIMCGFYSFEGLVWLLQPEYAFRTRASTIKVFGWGRCLFHMFGFIGVTAGFACIDQGMGSGSVPVAICLGAVLVLILLSTFVFTEHDLRRFVERPSRARSQAEQGGADAVDPPPAAADGLSSEEDRLVERLARAGGLSPRESEVLAYLGRGRSVPFIAETLVISKGTAKTHVRHIYEKLDVHSKQELLDLIERERQG